MELEPITDEQLEDLLAQGGTKHRGRVSYPICKMFLESGHKAAVLNIEHKNIQILAQVLRSYVKNHELPMEVLVRAKKLILTRVEEKPKSVDIDKPIDITKDSKELDEVIEEQGKMKLKKAT